MVRKWNKVLASLIFVAMMFSMLPFGAVAAGGLSNQSQVELKDAERFSLSNGEFVLDDKGDYLGVSSEGHDIVAIKQGTWSLVWTLNELTTEQQNEVKTAILNSDVQLSPGKGTFYFFHGVNTSIYVEEKNGSVYYASMVDGKIYLISKSDKISHFYYGNYDLGNVPQTYSVSFNKAVAVAAGSEQPVSGETFEFNLTDSNGRLTATVVFTLSELTSNDSKEVVFSDVPEGTYTLTESLVNSNWNSSISNGITVVVSEEGVTFDGKNTLTVTNTYNKLPPPTYSVSFNKAVAVAAGSEQPVSGETFEFNLTDSDGRLTATVVFTLSELTSNDSKEVVFSDVPEGTYTLTESLVNSNWNSSISDGITVVVSEEGVTFDGKNTLTVTNTYNKLPPPTYSVSFNKAVAVAAGSEQPVSGEAFGFNLTDSNGRLTATVVFTLSELTSNDSKEVVFSDVPEGTYTLTESLVNSNWNSSISDGITVVVSEEGVTFDGKNTLTVTNTYNKLPPPIEPLTGSLLLKGYKSVTVNGAESAPDEEFSFALTENGEVVGRATVKNEGTFEISVDYEESDIGQHTYMLFEEYQDVLGWSFDDTVYTIVVNVKAGESESDSACLVTEIISGDLETYEFVNIYENETVVDPEPPLVGPDSSEEEIPDEDVPLAPPKTGDAVLPAALAVLMALMAAGGVLLRKKADSEEK